MVFLHDLRLSSKESQDAEDADSLGGHSNIAQVTRRPRGQGLDREVLVTTEEVCAILLASRWGTGRYWSGLPLEMPFLLCSGAVRLMVQHALEKVWMLVVLACCSGMLDRTPVARQGKGSPQR